MGRPPLVIVPFQAFDLGFSVLSQNAPIALITLPAAVGLMHAAPLAAADFAPAALLRFRHGRPPRRAAPSQPQDA